jgi:hypothetical protein
VEINESVNVEDDQMYREIPARTNTSAKRPKPPAETKNHPKTAAASRAEKRPRLTTEQAFKNHLTTAAVCRAEKCPQLTTTEQGSTSGKSLDDMLRELYYV